MITPVYLKKGDKIILLSPAGKISEEKIKKAIEVFKSWELKVQIVRHALNGHFIFSAEKNKRFNDFQSAINDKNIKAIICTRGGYGSIHLIEKLDFTQFKLFPKWIVGYSDITIIHSWLNKITKCESIHGMMAIDFYTYNNNDKYVDALKNVLFGNFKNYSISSHKFNNHGKAKATLVGGNLTSILSLLDTPYIYSFSNKILFIEDIGEYVYHLDRMFYQLKLAGILGKLKGLIVGGMTKMKNKTEFGRNPYQVIYDIVKEYTYPIVFNFPAGHQKKNLPLIFGRKVSLEVNKKNTTLTFKK